AALHRRLPFDRTRQPDTCKSTATFPTLPGPVSCCECSVSLAGAREFGCGLARLLRSVPGPTRIAARATQRTAEWLRPVPLAKTPDRRGGAHSPATRSP